MSDRAYRDIYFEDAHVQAEFERLVQRIREAEQKRAPIGERQRAAERDAESGRISDREFRAADDAYIAAGNAIAAAQRAVDEFLHQNRNYRTR